MSTIGFVTCKNAQEARQIARALLSKRLIACANIIPNIESHYRWQGKIENATETLLLIKTNPAKTIAATKIIEQNHSYELPAIEFVNVNKTPSKVQEWISKETK